MNNEQLVDILGEEWGACNEDFTLDDKSFNDYHWLSKDLYWHFDNFVCLTATSEGESLLINLNYVPKEYPECELRILSSWEFDLSSGVPQELKNLLWNLGNLTADLTKGLSQPNSQTL